MYQIESAAVLLCVFYLLDLHKYSVKMDYNIQRENRCSIQNIQY